jgi:hypothetical protein
MGNIRQLVCGTTFAPALDERTKPLYFPVQPNFGQNITREVVAREFGVLTGDEFVSTFKPNAAQKTNQQEFS